jgi:Uncharacterized protein conserved in bacteria
MKRRRLLTLSLSLASAFAAPALAQPAGPSKPVRIVVPAPAGSSLDLIVRAMSEKLGARWGQPVVVENKPGAGGMLGMDVVAKATDGHTLAIGFNGPVAFAPFLYRKMPYDPAKDLLPVVMTTSQANVLAVNADKVPAKTVAELVTWAKAQGGKVNYSSLGNGSSAHLRWSCSCPRPASPPPTSRSTVRRRPRWRWPRARRTRPSWWPRPCWPMCATTRSACWP